MGRASANGRKLFFVLPVPNQSSPTLPLGTIGDLWISRNVERALGACTIDDAIRCCRRGRVYVRNVAPLQKGETVSRRLRVPGLTCTKPVTPSLPFKIYVTRGLDGMSKGRLPLAQNSTHASLLVKFSVCAKARASWNERNLVCFFRPKAFPRKPHSMLVDARKPPGFISTLRRRQQNIGHFWRDVQLEFVMRDRDVRGTARCPGWYQVRGLGSRQADRARPSPCPAIGDRGPKRKRKMMMRERLRPALPAIVDSHHRALPWPDLGPGRIPRPCATACVATVEI